MQSIINVRVVPQFSNTESIIEPCTPNESLNFSVSRCVIKPKGTKTVCLIVNPSDKPITLVRNQRIAFINKIEKDNKLKPLVDSAQVKVTTINQK